MRNLKKMRIVAAIGMMVCLSCLFTMTGCGSSAEEAAAPEVSVAAEETMTLPQVVEEETVTDVPNDAGQNSQGQEIGEDEALRIALKDAGLNASDVDYSNSHLDYDDGRTVYEVDFHQGNMEYDYDIDAYTGEILEGESEIDD